MNNLFIKKNVIITLTMCCLLGCSKNTSTAETESKNESVKSFNSSKVFENKGAIVPPEKITPDINWRDINGDFFQNNKVNYPNYSLSTFFESFLDPPKTSNRYLVKKYVEKFSNLNENQIIVTGDFVACNENIPFIISDNTYLNFSNNLAINFLRKSLSPELTSKGEFESTHDYENRMRLMLEKSKDNLQNYDKNLLSAALNISACDEVGVISNYSYDADAQILTLHNLSNYQRPNEINIKVKISPTEAEEYSHNSRIAHIFTLTKDNKLRFDGILFIKRLSTNQETSIKMSKMFVPIEYKQRSLLDKDVEKNIYSIEDKPFLNVLENLRKDFQLGLVTYQSPESLLQEANNKKP